MWFTVAAFFLTVGIVLCVYGLVVCCTQWKSQSSHPRPTDIFPLVERKK